MKKSKFTEAQIVFSIKQSDNGVTVSEISRKMGLVRLHFTTGRKIPVSWCDGTTGLRQLKDENTRLKQMVANLSRDKQMLQDVLQKGGVVTFCSCRILCITIIPTDERICRYG